MNFLELKVSLFANHHAYTSTLKSLNQILYLIRYDKIIAAHTESYRKTMHAMGKKAANTNIKEKLVPAFSVAVTFSGLGHGKEQASQFTGLALCDIDHFESAEELEAAFERLSKDPHVLLMYRTISGLGLRVIYWYKRENDKRIDDTSWRGAYIVGNEHLAAIAQHEYDGQASDYTRLSGMAGDPNVYFNPEAEPFVVTDDMIVVQNCEHQEHGRARKVYATKSFESTADDAWPRIEQMLNEKNVRYEPGHHHDYIMHAAYLFKRFGVPLDDVIKFGDIEWRDHPKEERQRAIRHQYKDNTLLGTWRLNANEKNRDNSLLTLPEIRKWLSERISCCYNTITCQVFWCAKADMPEAKELTQQLIEDGILEEPQAFSVIDLPGVKVERKKDINYDGLLNGSLGNAIGEAKHLLALAVFDVETVFRAVAGDLEEVVAVVTVEDHILPALAVVGEKFPDQLGRGGAGEVIRGFEFHDLVLSSVKMEVKARGRRRL